ncbi:MAG: hypothetical protein ISS70_21045 [Phycisphaerae bacterium]|nr:hypothetical protein [Phycisphaerae bacterium]
MTTFLIGIDDTDNEASPGTGRLARNLSAECARRGLRPLGVTRHQFLLDRAIAYTSHNSGACIAVESEGGLKNRDFIYDFVARSSADGSDPGVCIANASAVPDFVVEFADRATRQIVTMVEAFDRARQASITLCGLGGTCLGVIGAIGSVGLRASGGNGRFIDLQGLRELSGCVNAAAFDRIGIRLEHCHCKRAPDVNDRYETFDWVRPRLTGGEAVLPVQWSEKKNAWIPVDRKKHGTC